MKADFHVTCERARLGRLLQAPSKPKTASLKSPLHLQNGALGTRAEPIRESTKDGVMAAAAVLPPLEPVDKRVRSLYYIMQSVEV